MIATEDQLRGYLADLIEHVERLAVTLLPPNDGDEVALELVNGGTLHFALIGRPPLDRRSADVTLHVEEFWTAISGDSYARGEYKFELLDRELDFRRAYHQHDTDHFVRAQNVATHEHCESTIGVEICSHYDGQAVRDARDGFNRLYNLWLEQQKPDCSVLRCLE